MPPGLNGPTTGPPQIAKSKTHIDMVVYIDNYIVMTEDNIERANIAQVKESLSAYITMAEQGKTVVVCRRNRPVAELVRIESALPNRTRLGTAAGSVLVKCDLTEPAMDENDWHALQ